MRLKNIYTQSETIPAQIDGTYPPTREQLLMAGWRDVPELPVLADGNVRVSARLVEGDGVTGAWEVVDRLAADIEAEARAADKAANLDRWCYENAFMLLCQSYFGVLEKRGTADLLKKGYEMIAQGTPVAQVMAAFGLVISIDKELTRMGGDRWWDSVTFHNDPDAIAGAQKILGVTP